MTDAAQSDLTSGGAIVLVVALGDIALTDGADADGDVVFANGGSIRIEATDGRITADADVRSNLGHVSLYAASDLEFNSGADILVIWAGTIDLWAEGGVITFATNADQVSDGGDIRFRANGTITLGGRIETTGSVSLISDTATIVDGDSDGAVDVVASALRVSAIGFGTLANPVETDLGQFAAAATTGGIYLNDAGSVVVGTVSATVNRVAADATTSSVADAALTGAIATTSDIVLTAVGDLTIETVQTSTNVTLTSTSGSILDGGDLEADVIADNLTLNAETGVGQNGIAALDVDVVTLLLTNEGIGSAYLTLLSSTEIAGIELLDSGSLYLTQTTGVLTIAGAINITDGRAILSTSGALTVNADMTATDYLRTVSDSLDVNGAAITATEGDIELRVRGDVDFDATSSVEATTGNIIVVAGGTLRTSDMTAGGELNLRARSDILRNEGELTAANLKISSVNGQIGASNADPIFTNVDRIDASAAGQIFISEADSVEFGRSGIPNGGTNPGETITFQIGTGTISSVTGNVAFEGQGTFRIESTGDLTLATGITAANGNITIVTGTLSDGTPTEDILLEARNGRVTITATGSVGGAGLLDIEIASAELTTTTANGNIMLELRDTTTIIGDGVTIGSGSGDLVVNQTIGSLFLNANLAHFGAGNLNFDTVGTLTMNVVGRVITGSGAMDVFAVGTINLSQVRTTSGTIRLESETGSIRKIAGFLSTNIVSAARPEIYITQTADFIVDSASVRFNGVSTVFRSNQNQFITIFLDFS